MRAINSKARAKRRWLKYLFLKTSWVRESKHIKTVSRVRRAITSNKKGTAHE